MNTRRSGVITAALSVPAAAYGLAARLRNAWLDRAGAARAGALPIVSIGNLAVGGTGKTPLVAWLAKHLLDEGRVPAVVSRGYRGTAGRGPLLVSIGAGPRVDARACGDEPFLLARSLPGVVVVVGADRLLGVAAAAEAGATVVILDDGFQHRRLARDLDVVLLDGRAPFGNGRLLPAGPLREPPGALRRAGIVLLTRLAAPDPALPAVASVRATGFAGPVLRAGHTVAGFRTASGAAVAAPGRALGFCGIGDPALFRDDLEAAGVALAGFEAFRDHQPYDASRWARLVARARRLDAPLVTTEKDLARLGALAVSPGAPVPLFVVRIEAKVWDEKPFLEAVRRALPPPARLHG